MLFATYPSPAGYTPPPKRNNPLIIVLGVCGGCAVLGIIIAIALAVFGSKQPLFQRSLATGQFMAALTTHKYDAAEAQLTPEAQTSFPAEKLKQTEEGFETKYGAYQRFSQSGMDISNQKDPNSLSEIGYKLHYTNGSSTITLRFDPKGSGNKITAIEWNDTTGGNDGAGENTDAGHKKVTHKGGDGGE